ncbi:MAG: DUF2062 domain-containing protein [Geobacteraceae bacterium]|nr:DUF2062 domain-containing protein [Geobacteraceae bacterium]
MLNPASFLIKHIRTIFSSGMTPRKIALTICLGSVLGIMPLFWGTSLICLIFAHIFRLNQIAMQSVNYLAYPLQLALAFPFFKLGAWLIPGSSQFTVEMLPTLLQHPAASLTTLTVITLKAVYAWMLTALPAALLVYRLLLTSVARRATYLRKAPTSDQEGT